MSVSSLQKYVSQYTREICKSLSTGVFYLQLHEIIQVVCSCLVCKQLCMTTIVFYFVLCVYLLVYFIQLHEFIPAVCTCIVSKQLCLTTIVLFVLCVLLVVYFIHSYTSLYPQCVRVSSVNSCACGQRWTTIGRSETLPPDSWAKCASRSTTDTFI